VVQVNSTLNDDLALNSGPIEIISLLMRSLACDNMTLTLVKYNSLAHITSTGHIQTCGARRSKDLTRFDVIVSELAAGASPADTGVCTG